MIGKRILLLPGGYNIYPREVEEVLYEHEKIQEAVVVGTGSIQRRNGEGLHCIKKWCSCTEKELNEFSRKYLAAYKVPRLYEFLK